MSIGGLMGSGLWFTFVNVGMGEVLELGLFEFGDLFLGYVVFL
jgi:hypothetical protein